MFHHDHNGFKGNNRLSLSLYRHTLNFYITLSANEYFHKKFDNHLLIFERVTYGNKNHLYLSCISQVQVVMYMYIHH